MADKKFSEFPLVVSPVPADVTVVGLDSLGQNAQFPGDSFGGVTVHSALTGRSDADQHPQSAITDLVTDLAAKEDSLGNPASNGYILSSTTGGVRSWVAPGGGGGIPDAPTDGLKYTRQNAAWAIEQDAFYYKADDEPIAILAIGDSNMVGAGDTSGTLTLNTSVYVRSTPGTSAWDAADLAWFNDATVDPAASAFPNQPTAPVSFTGMLRNNNGDPAYAMATRLQQATGRDVYLFKTACGGKTMAYWLPGGGAGKEGMNALLAQVPPALLDMPVAVPFFDIVFMSDSTNDITTSVSATTFASQFDTVYNECVSQGWVDIQYTRWVQMSPTDACPGADTWMGLQYVSNTYGERFQVISGHGVPYVPTGPLALVHFTGQGYQSIGTTAADCTLIGLTTKPPINNGFYLESSDPLFKADADFDGFDLNNVGVLSAVTTTGTPVILRVEGNSAYDFKYTYSSSLQTTGLETGGAQGSWFHSRHNGTAAYPAFRLIATATLSGSSSLAAFGDQADLNLVTMSRTGLLNAKGGLSTDANITATGTVTATGAVSGGSLSVPGEFSTDFFGYIFLGKITASLLGTLESRVANGVGATAWVMDTYNAMAAASSRIITFKNAGSEKAYIDKDGLIGSVGLTTSGAITSSVGTITSTVASATNAVGFTFNTPDYTAHTGTLIADFKMNGTSKASISKAGLITSVGLTTSGAITATGGIVISSTAMTGTADINISGTITTSSSITANNLTATGTAQSLYFSVSSGGKYIGLTADGASAIAHKFDTNTAYSTTAKIASFQNNGTEKLSIGQDGTINGPGLVKIQPNVSAGQLTMVDWNGTGLNSFFTAWSNTYGWCLQSAKANSAGTAFNFDATTALSTAGSYIAQFQTNAVTKASIDYAGMVTCKGLSPAYRAVSGTSDTITQADNMVTYSSTSTVTATLPSAVTFPGLELIIKKTGASGTVNVTSVSSQTFDGAAGPVALSTQYHVLVIRSDGANWLKIKQGAV